MGGTVCTNLTHVITASFERIPVIWYARPTSNLHKKKKTLASNRGDDTLTQMMHTVPYFTTAAHISYTYGFMLLHMAMVDIKERTQLCIFVMLIRQIQHVYIWYRTICDKWPRSVYVMLYVPYMYMRTMISILYVYAYIMKQNNYKNNDYKI